MKILSRFALSLPLLLAGVTSHAEEDGVTASPQASSPATSTEEPAQSLGTITVTASSEAPKDAPLGFLKKDQASGALGEKSILDTPFSITVVDDKEILERGAKSIGQIFVNDAGVSTPSPSITTDWWGTQIRGLPVRNYYIDDIPMLLYWGGDLPLEAVESVTALKGLTGFMYGFGEPGGAISYQMKRPTPAAQTTINMGYRNPGLFSAHIDSSQNLGSDSGVRVNVATEQGTAYNSSKLDRSLIALAFDKGIGDSVTWFTNVMYEESTLEAEPFLFYFDSYDVAGSKGKLPTPTYDYDNFNVDNSYYETKSLIASTGLDVSLSENWSLRYQLGFSRKEHYSNKAFAGLLNAAGDYQGYMYNFAGQLDNLFNQAMITGTVSVAGLPNEIVGGIGYSRSKDKWASDFDFYAAFTGNIYEEQTFRESADPDFTLQPVSGDTTQQYVFLSDTVHFSEKWQLLAGLRFTKYDAEDMDDDPSTNSGYQNKDTTPTLALIYKPDEQTSFYGSYVQALEPGTVVGGNYENAGEVLDATISSQYELGVKHDSGRTSYTAALFRVERANQREERDGLLLYLTQDGLTVYNGVELAGAYQITDALNLGVSVIHLDASIEDVSAGSEDLAGNTPSNVADWQAVTFAEYKIASVEGLKLHGNVRYYGKAYVDDANTFRVPDYALANAGFSYAMKLASQALTVNGNINNLFNRKYWSSGGWGAGNMGEAINASLGLSIKF